MLWVAWCSLFMALSLLAVPSLEAAETIRLRVARLPLKENRDVGSRAEWAIVEQFMAEHPNIKVEAFRGMDIPGLPMVGPSMAMAGGVAPDVIYVNFRTSDSYIQQKFLYPLDEYVEQWAKEENLNERINPAVWPVIKRPGPDGVTHVWSLPYTTYVMALAYRKDLFRQAGLDPNRPPKDWDELYEYAQKLTRPEKGQYGMNLIGGPSAAWYFINFLWSAGGEAVRQDKDGQWRAAFNDTAAVEALKFYQKMTRTEWTRNGKTYRGVVYRVGNGDDYTKWNLGELGMNLTYLSDELMANLDPNLVGVAPVPVGPGGHRGNELNCAMWGINSQCRDKTVRDAAWEYIKFWASDKAQRIRADVYVANGYAKFIAPHYLRRFGYERYLREVPPGWEETLAEALRSGRPEPYGRKCEMIYTEMTPPLDAVAISDRTDYQALLDRAVKHADERMIGILPPDVRAFRNRVATGIVLIVAVLFTLLLRVVFRSFSSDVAQQQLAAEENSRARLVRHWKKTWPAYCILLPALVSVFLWQYYPLARGSVMSFQDYRLIGPSKWVWLENFSNVLFEPRFWRAMLNSGFYAALSLGLGFGAPILLALMLHEVPRGKILLRTLYYLPAATTALVTMLLWKQFYDPGESGVLNRLLATFHLPAQTWLNDPNLAMISVIVPLIWAGMGPGCIIYLAALKSIPEEYYEAADLDGAGIWHKIRYITLPYLRPLIIINFVGAFIGAFRSFDAVFAMTGGGPLFATHVAGLEIWYNAFLYLNFGYAVSAAWILGSLLVGFTVWQLRILSKIQFKTAEA